MGFLSGLFGRRPATDLFKGFTDRHSHILPGVDDGFATTEDSIECLDIYAAHGFSDVWLTPHIMEDCPNTTQHLRQRFDEFKEAYKGPVKLHLASENMIDSLFVERLDAGDLLPMGDHLLVETTYFTPPSDLYGILDEIARKGYFPLLAHPERYRYMGREDYERLIKSGVALQLNLFSLTGAYGTEARDKAHMLLKMGAYRVTGTDIHRTRQSKMLDDIICNHNLNQHLISSGLLKTSTLKL